MNTAGIRPGTLLKTRIQHRYFPVNILKNICERLLLQVYCWNLQRHILQFSIYIFHLQFCSDTIFTFEIQVLYWVSICKLLKIWLSRLNCELKIFYKLLLIRTIFKTLVLRSIFRFAAFVNYLVESFFTSLPLISLLYIQHLNGIIGITNKNSST